jgi:hypothetical protein
MVKEIKTHYRVEKEKHEMKVYEDYMQLIGAQVPKVTASEVVMKKHGIHARSTVWSIIKRVQARKNQ